MKLINYLIILTLFLLSSTFAKEKPPFKNILSLDKPKTHKEIIFQDIDGSIINLTKASDAIRSCIGNAEKEAKILLKKINVVLEEPEFLCTKFF